MRSLLRALGLFSVVPVPPTDELTKEAAAAALRWLPLVGATLGAVAGLPIAAAAQWSDHGSAVAAVLAVAVLTLLTRGLHLDGLADTADGLGSRSPADRALEIMRRSDIGPFGVVTLIVVLLLDAVALASLTGAWTPVAALAVAAATGRVAVLGAAHRRVPAARGSGFGAFVARSVSTPVLIGWTVVALAAGGLMASCTGQSPVAWIVGQAIALAIAAAFLAHVVRRIGGVTGDVFGALAELGTVAALAAFALAA